MANEILSIGQIQQEMNSAGNRVLKYSVQLHHHGLNEHKAVSDKDAQILQQKIQAQIAKWDEKWKKVEHKRREAEKRKANEEEAQQRTKTAIHQLKEVEHLLHHALATRHALDWERFKVASEYARKHLQKPQAPPYNAIPPKPDRHAEEFIPQYSLVDKLMKSKREQKEAKCKRQYTRAVKKWEIHKERIERKNTSLKQAYDQIVAQWAQKCQKYAAEVDKLKIYYMKQHPKAVLKYCELVLQQSPYPASFPRDFILDYNADTRILIVEYTLPSSEHLPALNEVKYIVSKKEFKEYYISQAKQEVLFDLTMLKLPYEPSMKFLMLILWMPLMQFHLMGGFTPLILRQGKRKISAFSLFRCRNRYSKRLT